MPAEARAYPRPLPNPEWLGKLTEEILEPLLPIVDPHHHLWDHPGSRYLLDDFLADVNSGHTSSRPFSFSAARATAPAAPRRCGRSARASSFGRSPRRPTGAAVDQDLRGHCQLRRSAPPQCRRGAGRPDRSGRRPVSRHPPDCGARPSDHRRLVLRAAAGTDGRPGVSARPEAAAGAQPDLRGLALPPADQDADRGGARRSRGEDRAEPLRWAARGGSVQARRGVSRLARRRQGAGGLPEYVRKAGWAGDDRQRLRFSPGAAATVFGRVGECVAAYVETCIEVFGANRCMFESHFPVDKGACSYPVLFNAFKRLASEPRSRKRPTSSPAPRRGSTGWATWLDFDHMNRDPRLSLRVYDRPAANSPSMQRGEASLRAQRSNLVSAVLGRSRIASSPSGSSQ